MECTLSCDFPASLCVPRELGGSCIRNQSQGAQETDPVDTACNQRTIDFKSPRQFHYSSTPISSLWNILIFHCRIQVWQMVIFFFRTQLLICYFPSFYYFTYLEITQYRNLFQTYDAPKKLMLLFSYFCQHKKRGTENIFFNFPQDFIDSSPWKGFGGVGSGDLGK